MSQETDLQHENARLRRLLAQAGIDAAASDVASNLQKVIISELSHRVKNLLAMVLAITTRTLETAKDLATAREAISGRIMALARSHDLVLEGNLDAAPLKLLIENAVEPFAEANRLTISVPDVVVSATPPAMALSLVVNELCTNAVKYGALSNVEGRVNVTGAINEAGDVVTLVWTESGGPPVEPNPHRSFGSKMIEVSIPNGAAKLSFLPGGVVCELAIPLASLT